MTKFRPCIDIHVSSFLVRALFYFPSRHWQPLFANCDTIQAGAVKQIVGGTLSDSQTSDTSLVTNHTSTHPASYFAKLYHKHGLTGAHIIMLGPGCTEAAESALAAWPRGLQIGGGINGTNAQTWIDKGAEKVW